MDGPCRIGWKKLAFMGIICCCILFTYLIAFQQHNDGTVQSVDRGIVNIGVNGGPRQGKIGSLVVEHYDEVESGVCNDKCQKVIQADRLKKAADVCSQVDSRSIRPIDQSFVDSLWHVYVLDRYKVLFCYVPKVACTNWKRTIMTLLGLLDPNREVSHLHIHYSAADKLPTLKNFKTTEAVKRLNSYKKILFVREPTSRLLSAYRDKLETPHNDDAIAFRKAYSARVKGIDYDGVEHNTSFYEFISYVGNANNKMGLPGEEHWRTVDELCRPCNVQYDFIGRMETLERDRDYVLRHIFGVDPERYRHHASTNPTNSSHASIVRDYLADIPKSKLRALYERFRFDYDAFGYASPVS